MKKLFQIRLVACYRKMDVIKSFKTPFTTYKMDNYISSYEIMKFEKLGKQNYNLFHIDRKLKALAI